MIKELVQFTEHALADPVFSNLGVVPREGLHIVLQVVKTPEHVIIDEKPIFSGLYPKKVMIETVENGKKKKKTVLEPISEKLSECARKGRTDASWNFGTNKLFDDGAKSIHTCSPFAFAFKRESLELKARFHPVHKKIKNFEDEQEIRTAIADYLGNGTRKYDEDLIALRKEIAKKGDTKDTREKRGIIFDRVPRYFRICREKLEIPEEYVESIIAFEQFLKDKNRVNQLLESLPDFPNVEDDQYIFFYLDVDVEVYRRVHRKYLQQFIFNQASFNMQGEAGEWFGTSNYFNTFNIDKPFLTHQTALFSISGRVSSKEAQIIEAFSDLKKILPNPLPLFVYEDERTKSFKVFTDDVKTGAEKRKPYLDIMAEMWNDENKRNQELGNYYLLFQSKDGIQDFDFVSCFEYELKDNDGKSWQVIDIFKYKDSRPETLENIRQLAAILPDFFNSQMIFRWFEDVDTKFFKKRNNYQLTMKHRKAFYDFIYKSQRQGVTQKAIEEILLTGIMDDIAADKQEKEGFNIRKKLNLLFSLHQYFHPKIKHPFYMATKIEELRQHLNEVAEGKANITSDDQFAFAAGQMLARIYMQSETADRSFKFSEPFLRQTRVDRFVKGIQDFFVRYSHKPYANRFTTVSAEVLTYPSKNEIRDFENLKPLVLAGIFFKRNLLLSDNEKTNEDGMKVVE